MIRGMRIMRHLEGWQPGLLAIGIAISGALLALPHKVAPEDVPPPAVDQLALEERIVRDRERAAELAPRLKSEAAGGGPTPLYDLRALGTHFREFGLLDSAEERDDAKIVEQRRMLSQAAVQARKLGEEELLALRAYQMEAFLNAARTWEETRVESEELGALGGPFLKMLERNGWLRDGRILPGEAIRRIFFKRRWNELTGLTQGPFALSLDEERAFYRFILDNPSTSGAAQAPGAEVDSQAIDRWRLRKLGEIAQIDPAYPYDLGRGVLLYRLGAYMAAAEAFRDHLAEHPDGAYALRARNYLMAALDQAGVDP